MWQEEKSERFQGEKDQHLVAGSGVEASGCSEWCAAGKTETSVLQLEETDSANNLNGFGGLPGPAAKEPSQLTP